LVVTKVPRASRLLTGHDKSFVARTDSKILALDCAYIDVNKSMRGVLRVELDWIFGSWRDVAAACQNAGIPQPSVAVGWVDAQRRVHHPHLLWILYRSVFFLGKKDKALRCFNMVLRGLTFPLNAYGADPGGLMNPLRMKNPRCPWRNRQVLTELPYNLTDLFQHVQHRAANISQASHQPRGWPSVSDDPDERVASLGQSNYLFRQTAWWARQNVIAFRSSFQSFDAFYQAIANEAVQISTRFSPRCNREMRDALSIARSVAQWTWKKYNPPQRAIRLPLTPEERHMRQVLGGQKAAAGRRAATEAAIIKVVDGLTKQNVALPRQATVAAALKISVRLVERHWPAVKSWFKAAVPSVRSEELPDKRLDIEKKLSDIDDSKTYSARYLYISSSGEAELSTHHRALKPARACCRDIYCGNAGRAEPAPNSPNADVEVCLYFIEIR
jgi:hypothetical protein